MSKTVLQIPIDATLRREAEKQALAQGLSSLQEAVRIFLRKLAERRIGISLEEAEEAVQLSPRAIRRYNKMTEDFKKGRNIHTAKSVDDLMKQMI